MISSNYIFKNIINTILLIFNLRAIAGSILAEYKTRKQNNSLRSIVFGLISVLCKLYMRSPRIRKVPYIVNYLLFRAVKHRIHLTKCFYRLMFHGGMILQRPRESIICIGVPPNSGWCLEKWYSEYLWLDIRLSARLTTTPKIVSFS